MVRDSERFVEERMAFFRAMESLSLLLDGNNREREAKAEGSVDADFDGIDAMFLELKTTEDVHIRRVSVERGKRKLHFTLSNGILVIGIEDERVLNKVPHPSTPARPQAKFEKADRHHGGRNHADDSDQRLLSACLLADVLAKNARLEIG